jgi:pimeloyl-ACP methyl ester carboxylesterase
MSLLRFRLSGLVLLGAWMLSGGAAWGQVPYPPGPPGPPGHGGPSPRPGIAPGIVFTIPGADGSQRVVGSMESALEKAQLPLRAKGLEWSSGDFMEDICNEQLHQRSGWRLAQQIMACRQMNPGLKVYLVGHSAGCSVALAATQWLPPNSIDRIVLLAPCVPSDYDLRCALTASARGIDVFYCKHDELLQLYDGRLKRKAPCAGLVGFRPMVTPQDACLYQKLRQYGWRPEFEQYGSPASWCRCSASLEKHSSYSPPFVAG